ncbi:hypothetical protein [Halalkalibacter lacteus]|uniref:hypothetical protein n=1 Tax=Halalkalibacter lacteus TaxID=3090663 RepID=UPI002FCA2257
MIRLFFVMVGFTLAVVGGVSILAYLNLLIAGYQFSAYLLFLIERIEFYLFLIGVAMIIISMTFPTNRNRDRKKS